METIDYTPTRTAKSFIKDYIPSTLFYDWLVGPVGSGKTTVDFMKLIYLAQLQKRGPDGVRRSRCAIVRNTAPQLKDTTMKSWFDWFKPGVAGVWHATDKLFDFKFGDVECEVMFRALDTEEDISRVLSLELTFAIVDEFREVPKAIIEALSGRLSRYPSRRNGGATNYGMWGASNPGTEDVWWYDHLHNEEITEKIELYGLNTEESMRRLMSRPSNGRTTRYFHQPGGMHPQAENLENLAPYERGNHSYYINHSIGKSPAYIKQYVDAEWGFSSSETPVIKTFNSDRHIAKGRMKFNPMLPLIGGFDPGRGGMAMIFMQEDLYGRLNVLGEVGAVGFGVQRFIDDRLRPYIRGRFPDADFVVAPDPASWNKAQTNESAVVDVLRKHFTVKEIGFNNRLQVRLDAIEHYTTRTVEDGMWALAIDKDACPMLARALAGGWRFERVRKSTTDEFKVEPEKNAYSHYGDAFGYGCCYYHKQFKKSGQHGQLRALTGRAAPKLISKPVHYF